MNARSRTARPHVRRKRRASAATDWRPTWDDYAEVTMAASEPEVIAVLARIVRRRTPQPTLRALARAGLIGTAPGWRHALRDDFRGIEREAAAAAVAAIERKIAERTLPHDKWLGFLQRAAIAARGMGIRRPRPKATAR